MAWPKEAVLSQRLQNRLPGPLQASPNQATLAQKPLATQVGPIRIAGRHI